MRLQGQSPAAIAVAVEIQPPRWWMAQIVVRRPLGRVFEGGIGFGGLFEIRLAVRRLGHIGVVLARQLAVRLLDVVQTGGAGHAQSGVIVFVSHGGISIRLVDLCALIWLKLHCGKLPQVKPLPRIQPRKAQDAL
jgi:hypothetical protein